MADIPPHIYRPPPIHKMGIVYNDPDLVVIDKPSGLLSVPGRGDGKSICASAYAEQIFGPVLTVHRLDMDTSGLMIFGRTKRAQAALSRQFEKRRIKKIYEAVIDGHPDQESGLIDLPIAKYSVSRPLRHIEAGGQVALTRWRVLARSQTASRVQLEPETGRSHQLRLHMAAIGHGILGDNFYGPAERTARLMLHACGLTLFHPETNETLQINSTAPF